MSTLNERRRFSGAEKTALWLAADGVCERCGATLEPGWHADHVEPYSKGGDTDVANGQALCPSCNRSKGAESTTEPLRAWQQHAIRAYFAAARPDFLVVATPGAGKTRVACELGERRLLSGTDLLVVVVPTEPLKAQWADEFAQYGVKVAPYWQPGPFPPDVRGVAVTYQALLGSAGDVLRRECGRRGIFGIVDEIHHCNDTSTWGERLRYALEGASARLALSGTPFRSDNYAIPFVRYVDGIAEADYTYGYAEAVADGVCRPLFFPRRGGEMEWHAASGDLRSATFDDSLDDRAANERLRTAISVDGGWLRSVLEDAGREIDEYRTEDDDAACLVLADDVRHAEAIARLLDRATLVTSDEPEARDRIEGFRGGHDKWIVAVNMVSEGVDIPRIRVIVYATVKTTELFFRQAVGRAVRVERDSGETATVFIPDDARLREFASRIRQDRTHALDQLDRELDEREGGERDAEPSSFMPVSSTAVDRGVIVDAGDVISPEERRVAEQAKMLSSATAGMPTNQVALLLRNARHVQPSETREPAPERADWRRDGDLRDANHRTAKRIRYEHGVDFSHVNQALNSAIGVPNIKVATTEQLERRLDVAQRWLKTGNAP
jgi:superfamily II DNA or RNA helicase